MPLIETITDTSKLYHDLKQTGRENFSYEGANALQAYLEELSDDMGENIDYDPIAFCCDYTEYADSEIIGLAYEYDEAPKLGDLNAYDDEEALKKAIVEWLRENTSVIEFTGGIITQAF